jgi:hypothetical protein
LPFALAGCTTVTQAPKPVRTAVSPETQAQQAGWWYLRFRLERDDEGGVNSFLDALIADQLLSDLIERHQADIGLWRFHRRWPDDTTGHQFSFVFYAPGPLAANLVTEVERHPLLAQLDADGHLAELRLDRAPADRAADPAATSDPSWPPDIQREWPKFIMGASRMWLGLVQTEAARHGDLAAYERYRVVEEALDELWYHEANHAFFHHLSALFGYKPMRVIRREIMTF